jgi:outer membrane lipoprotein carrier protein
MFAHAIIGFIALAQAQLAPLPQKAADAAAATRPAPTKPVAPTPAPAPAPAPPATKPQLATPIAAGPSAAQVVADVQKYYNATNKFEAHFRQKYTNTIMGKTSISDGKVYIEKPGKMRWDYQAPDIKYYISDGTTLWVYEKANKQAIKQSLENQLLPVAITFLYGQGDLSKDFTPSLDAGKFGAPTDRVVKLVPKAPTAQYKSLWLVVDPADGHVKESIIEEVSGNLNSFSFTQLKTNEKATYVGANLFKFVPPKGVKVITPPAGAGAPPSAGSRGNDNGK